MSTAAPREAGVSPVDEVLEELLERWPEWKAARSAVGAGLRRAAESLKASRDPPRSVDDARRRLLVWSPVLAQALVTLVSDVEDNHHPAFSTDSLQSAAIEVTFGEKQPETVEQATAFLIRRATSREIDAQRKASRHEAIVEGYANASRAGSLTPVVLDIRIVGEEHEAARLTHATLVGLCAGQGESALEWWDDNPLARDQRDPKLARLVRGAVWSMYVALRQICDGDPEVRGDINRMAHYRQDKFRVAIAAPADEAGVPRHRLVALVRAISREVWPTLESGNPELVGTWGSTWAAAHAYSKHVWTVAGTKTRRNSRLSDEAFGRGLPRWRELATLWLIGAPILDGCVDVGLFSMDELLAIKASTTARTAADDPRLRPTLDKVHAIIRAGRAAALQAGVAFRVGDDRRG